jgi:hypothetical protein
MCQRGAPIPRRAACFGGSNAVLVRFGHGSRQSSLEFPLKRHFRRPVTHGPGIGSYLAPGHQRTDLALR